jgi:23S rRNA (cytidine1920-2'-O)/16S rRNA (cytidine1409-2'-O)-methyltransferase
LARSRAHAAELIAAGVVTVDGQAATKPASQVDPAQAVEVGSEDAGDQAYASRGAHKLLSALAALGRAAPAIDGVVCLDAGASTGGFTDVLLRRGAALVHAVDVGYGQLVWRLRQDPRVNVVERTNVRFLEPGDLEPAPSLVVADLSFISLTQVLPALAAVTTPRARFLLMVKPQFEVGKRALPAGGVVTSPDDRAGAVWRVAQAAQALGLAVLAVARSGLPGPKGNVEFFLDLGKAGALAGDPGDGAGEVAGEVVGGVGLSGQALIEAIERETAGHLPA